MRAMTYNSDARQLDRWTVNGERDNLMTLGGQSRCQMPILRREILVNKENIHDRRPKLE